MVNNKQKSMIMAVSITLVSLIVGLLLVEGLICMKNKTMKNYDIEMWKYAKELKMRSENPLLGHEHIPLRSAILQSVNIRINEKGLRGGPVPALEGTARRIIFLGGSITLGWGVPEEATLTSQLQDMYAKDHIGVNVLNAGIGNYNAPRYVNRFLTKLTDVKPTDIVVQYFLRDAERLDTEDANFLLRHSQAVLTLWIAWNRLFKPSGEDVLEKHYRTVYDKDAQGFKEMEDALEKLSSYAAKNKIRIYLAMTPDVHNLKNYKFHYIHEIMRNISKKHGYNFIDLFDAFKGLSQEDVWAMPGDPHPNALGHRKMAEIIYPYLSMR